MRSEQVRIEDMNEMDDLWKAAVAAEKSHASHLLPNRAAVWSELENRTLRLVREEGLTVAAYSLADLTPAEQFEAAWLFGTRPGVIRLRCILPASRSPEMIADLLKEMQQVLRENDHDAIRLGLPAGDTEFLQLAKADGFRPATMSREGNLSEELIWLDKPLEDGCPLLPLRMVPAFRGGSLTPWGGTKLRELFGKAIPNPTTGESLECSCIPGLESRDCTGVTLPQLIERFGTRFVGAYADKPFPLLLKLLDARESLSVQVHPNDRYAFAKENGKLGKTEAWLILAAQEDSTIVWGIEPGTTHEMLASACAQGAAVSPLLRRVAVQPGDVCFIPAGCVHAIGAGIVLYEIQQSSDVTYRFFDWDRKDAQGHSRELHLRQALDVTDLSYTPKPLQAQDLPCEKILDTDYFSLFLLKADRPIELPHSDEFSILTALDELNLRWNEGSSMLLAKGETVLIPASCPPLMLNGGRAALSMPSAPSSDPNGKAE